MKEWTNEKTYPRRQAKNKCKAHSLPLLPQKTAWFFKINITIQLLAHNWNITFVLNHPTEQSF